jgi:hypothetical protein
LDDSVDWTVSAWFTSRAVALTVGRLDAVRAVYTVTVEDAPEVWSSGVTELSVICSSKL